MDINSNFLLKAIVESTIDGIILIDCKGIIRFVNDSTCKLFGYDRSELVGGSMNVLLPDGIQPDAHDKYIQNYIKTGQAKIVGIGREVVGKRKDNKVFPFWLRINETKIGDTTYFTGFIHDLSEQKKTERSLTALTKDLEEKVSSRTKELGSTVSKLLKINVQLGNEIKDKEASEIALRRSEETLKSALKNEKHLSEMKSRFLSMASHEFKTPLSAILSSASILKRYTLTEQQENRDKHIEKIKKMIRQLNDVLNDFLSVERLDGNEIETTASYFDVTPFLVNVVEEMDGNLKHGQTIITTFLTKEKTLFQDSHILRIILRNLLSNAVKYSAEGTKIQLVVSTTPFDFVFEIKDEGIGIPEDEQSDIFTRFYRSSNATNIKGTGLGLAIAKRYLDVMGGRISFKSESGQGSTFVIKLPKNEKK